MRNVPVGSGRRKTKPTSPGSHRLITITDDRRIHNETVLCFGSDAPGHAEKMEEQSVSSSKESDVNLNFSYPWISSFPATYLGKHSRNEEEQGMKKSNPKKQRIDRNCKELAMGCIGIEQRV
ncbi:hypothetical protein AXF42_Ash002076 [Apostasia shenzhenica]|uniref:Uncharacterized protein n=1 Tax=Apostasia shenzhenica TaxID=1088818 RepID=A0A2I0AMJ6_9ASPA|nr:hypothetical protein AXF42_Ash002076 [Apostasia shenzhenica]